LPPEKKEEGKKKELRKIEPKLHKLDDGAKQEIKQETQEERKTPKS